MNRIRKLSDDNYQVLITPHHRFNSNIEFLLTSWTDPKLRGFKVKEFSTFTDATVEAYRYPEIDWDYMIAIQKGVYDDLHHKVARIVDGLDFVANFKPKMMNGLEAKDHFFNRVVNQSKNFTLLYDMSDIITFKITNPWTKNLREMAYHFQQFPDLGLIRKYESNGVIHLVGETDVHTTYEIVLCPDLIDHWQQWMVTNAPLPEDVTIDSLKDILKAQKKLDDTCILR